MNDVVMSKSINLLSSYLVQYFVVLYFNDEDESLCYYVMNDYGR
jgi:hypothetical protein